MNPVRKTHPISLRSVLTLSSQLRPALPNGPRLLVFPLCVRLSHTCYIPYSSHPPSQYFSNYIWRSVQVMKLLIPQFSPGPHGSRCASQHTLKSCGWKLKMPRIWASGNYFWRINCTEQVGLAVRRRVFGSNLVVISGHPKFVSNCPQSPSPQSNCFLPCPRQFSIHLSHLTLYSLSLNNPHKYCQLFWGVSNTTCWNLNLFLWSGRGKNQLVSIIVH
jgi:hypothetical protein